MSRLRFAHRTMASLASRPQKSQGDISAVFTSLRTDPTHAFPPRFAELKHKIWNKGLEQSWKEVLAELDVATERIAVRGEAAIPQVSMDSIRNGLSTQEASAIRDAGCVVVRGAVPKEEAIGWKRDIQKYVETNRDKVKGFPADNIQVYELYNTASQMRARTNPNVLETQRVLLSLWHDHSGDVSLDTPISYFDRLRIRFPGDTKFALGPHVDAGSIERWEDSEYRRCFHKILEGGSAWRQHDPYAATPRVHAKQDLYNAPNQCSIFRPWQGWTALSSTGPGEGTLRVLPMLTLATAYWMLRPFFRARHAAASLEWHDWNALDLDAPGFAGCGMGTGLELSSATHPHLRLAKTMISVPRVDPGDQVYWHCDMIHAVESRHGGKEDSSVMYIPAVPLTLDNAQYLRDQRSNFRAGLPAPDFPGGPGESTFVGRGTIDDVHDHPQSLRAVGFGKFAGGTASGDGLLAEADRILDV